MMRLRGPTLIAIFFLFGAQAFAQSPATLDALDERVAGISAKFVPIPAGEFEMGCDDRYWRSEPHLFGKRHRVRLTQEFEIQVTEVTQAQWSAVMGNNPSHLKSGPNYPVEQVSWNNVQAFIEKLNQSQTEFDYRLPTEAEWEYASRGGQTTREVYFFGALSDELPEHAWYNNYINGSHMSVAQKLANPYGLYDMYGNVAELVQDFVFSGDLIAQRFDSVTVDPKGPSQGHERVVKGGCYATREPYYVSSCVRVGWKQRNFYVGFRLVRTRRGGSPKAVPSTLPMPEKPAPFYDESF